MHQGYGAADLSQLQATMQAIETACSSIQMHVNPAAAEATILSLRQSSRPYQACKFILENSQLASARFQAAGAIRDAAVREWEFLEANDKTGLISFCLWFIMKNASSPEGFVLAKVASVAAQLLKRGWFDFAAEEKETFFLEVKQAITGSHGLDAQFVGVNFLESLVSEFSPSTSTAMGLPREFHEKCRTSLEQTFIKAFYCWVQDAAFNVSNRIVGTDVAVPESKVCSAALRLMLQILNWDFRGNKSANESSIKGIDVFCDRMKPESNSFKRSECVLVQPGTAWRDVLISSGHVEWLLNLYGALRQKFSREGYWLDCPLAVSARKLLVQFCSLSGTIFPSDNGYTQRQLLLRLLAGILPWVEPPDAVSNVIECGKSESELLDGCRALLSIATVTAPLVFDELLKSMRPHGTLGLLSDLTSEVIKDVMRNHGEEETWSWVARDILLDTWTALLMLDGAGHLESLPPEGIISAGNLFMLIVESELKVASASAFGDENEHDYFQASITAMDERLSSYALIARSAIGVTAPFLTKLFSDLFLRLHQVRGVSDPTETLEELYSLLLIAGHVLADEGQSETPLVPKEIQTQFADIVEADKHPIIVLYSSIIKFAEQSLDPEIRTSLFSPRLMEAVVWFLARWSSTYLMPTEKTSGNKSSYNAQLVPVSPTLIPTELAESPIDVLLSFCDENNQGKVVLDIIIRISLTTLVSYPGEKDLQALACYQLLHGLVRQRNIIAHLVTLGSWCDFVNAFASESIFFTLNMPHQRSLAQTLAVSASGLKTSEESNQYVKNLTSHMTMHFMDLSSKKDLKTIAQQPDIILLVSCLLERLRGVASASEPNTQKAIYDMGFSLLNPVLIFLEAYKDEPVIVYLLLKFVVNWVDGQITYLEAQETAAVVNFCMRLLQLYSSHNIGKISVGLSNSLLRAEADVEKYKDLSVLLKLLSNLCSKDLVDFASEPLEAHGINISQVVYTGLHIVTPLITVDLLKFPKLCHGYFSLLSHLLEVYPEMIARLNIQAFNHIVGTLDFGLRHQDIEVVDMCLRALKAIASHHYKERVAGKTGLGSHATSYKDPGGEFHEGILSRFLHLLLQILLFEDYSSDLVASSADALLPLILCEQNVYQNLVNELLERQATPTFKARLMTAFQSLTSSNNLSLTLDRVNYQRFRKNLHSFLIEVRGFLRTI